ncbi:hypothetical protein ACVU7I_08150, partial [Patulibacter sp. S7RM1-6]
AGAVVTGPAVVREPTTTLVVPPGVRGVVTPGGDYLLDVAPAGADAPETTPAEEAIAR